uniref:Uncharacterized protein n=1 Tax=Myoviridae sp. ctPkm1 TaxID=2825099 RepID=A0A8S5TYE8_9CAUD|nr:MAG TPA: hypothetical protein [Myoviridae sp. ctPkm1]
MLGTVYHGTRGDPRKSREVHRAGGLRGVSSPDDQPTREEARS